MTDRLLLLCMVTCSSGAPASLLRNVQTETNPTASKDQMHVLMYGVLQFGETLHRVYQSTDAKVAQIESSMRRREAALEKLGLDAGQAAERKRHIGQILVQLRGQLAGLQSDAERAKGKLARMEQEETELRTKVTNLETYLQNNVSTRIQELKERVSEHSGFLEGLRQVTQLQQQTIRKQNQQLRALQKTRAAMRWQLSVIS
ncbi:hypothetical protein DPEC_G00279400 [Dallia pectoralis]|uniref:Uncharacterized protein n=1 Tax=Dallia pectoralis TaxID=75939 RepID=A0ACC2FMI4_DALPE|nr:hypothetical protein DPEC_G00279400 [Dallia pectoralis]